MMYFRIDLNRLEDTRKARQRERREGVFFCVLAAFMLLLAVWMFHSDRKMAAKINRFQATKTDLQNKINAFQSNEGYISEDDVRDLYELTRERIFWSEKLQSISERIGKNLVLTEIQYDEKKLVLRGLAQTGKGSRFELISDFIDSLKAEPSFTRDFPRIEFGSTGRERSPSDLMNFEVICSRN